MLELVEFNNTLTVEVNSESGCYYHRIGNPLRYVDINPKAPTLYFSRLSGFAPWQMKEMRAQGVNIVMDLDDDIILPRNHVLYDAYKQQGTTEKMIENIRSVGAEYSLLSSDLGQPFNPPVEDGLALMADQLLEAGFAEDEVRMMAVTNTALLAAPATLVGGAA